MTSLSLPTATPAKPRKTWAEFKAAILDRIAPLVPEGHPWAEPSRLDRLDGVGLRGAVPTYVIVDETHEWDWDAPVGYAHASRLASLGVAA